MIQSKFEHYIKVLQTDIFQNYSKKIGIQILLFSGIGNSNGNYKRLIIKQF